MTQVVRDIHFVIRDSGITESPTHFQIEKKIRSTPAPYLRWSDEAVNERLSAINDPATVSVARYPASATDLARSRSHYHFYLGWKSGRGAEYAVLLAKISEQLCGDAIDEAVVLFDKLALALEVESGNAHESADKSDQNELGPDWFDMIGKPLPKERMKFSEKLGRTIVDLEQNPSHSHVVKGVTFTAAWCVYFGPEFKRYVDLSRCAELEVDEKYLSKNITRIRVFDDPFEFDDPLNIEKLWAFRRKLEIDEIAHPMDPPL